MAALANPNLWKPGEAHPRWKGGRTVTRKGYIRRKHGTLRDMYEHRAVATQAINEGPSIPPPFVKGEGLPKNFEVHHIDRNRAHNCRANLLILEDVIHHAFPNYQKNRKVRLAEDSGL